MDNTYQIICTVNNKVITVEEINGIDEDAMGKVVQSIYRLKERAIREALISQGWTPPVFMPREGLN